MTFREAKHTSIGSRLIAKTGEYFTITQKEINKKDIFFYDANGHKFHHKNVTSAPICSIGIVNGQDCIDQARQIQ